MSSSPRRCDCWHIVCFGVQDLWPRVCCYCILSVSLYARNEVLLHFVVTTSQVWTRFSSPCQFDYIHATCTLNCSPGQCPLLHLAIVCTSCSRFSSSRNVLIWLFSVCSCVHGKESWEVSRRVSPLLCNTSVSLYLYYVEWMYQRNCWCYNICDTRLPTRDEYKLVKHT